MSDEGTDVASVCVPHGAATIVVVEMGVDAGHQREEGGLTLLDFLRVLKRRKWLILQVLLLTPLAAIAISLQQERLYEASADVLLSRENLAANLTPGTVDPIVYQQPERVAQTQADLARVPTVVRRVLEKTGQADRTTTDFLESSDVEPKSNSDLLQFRVRDGDRNLAVRLATAYAREYTNYRRQLDTAALGAARQKVEARIEELEREGQRDSALYASLVEKQDQLETLEALNTANSTLVRPADRAEQVQPRLLRNAILAVLLALVLGLGLAFLWEALDTRVRTAQEIGSLLQLPLLARLPAPPAQLRKSNGLVMLDRTRGPEAEAFRMLRTNLEFVSLNHGARTVMVTSALPREGKSTSIANLAVATALAGKRVTLVDLDFRRPFIHRFFKLRGGRGVTDVALGRFSLDRAVVQIPLSDHDRGDNGAWQTNGALQVLAAGIEPPDPGEFVAGEALTRVLAEIRDQSELVLIDAPPSLGYGDALSLSTHVEGIVVVVHSALARRPILKELRRILDSTPTRKLGFVLTGAETEEGYGYATYRYAAGEAEEEAPARTASTTGVTR